MAFKDIEFTVITPMFLNNAYGNNSVELRPPSFKGMLRFWWRAIMAMDVDKLRDQEAHIFGSSDESIGRSKIQLLVEYKDEEVFFDKCQFLPHHEGGENCSVCKEKKMIRVLVLGKKAANICNECMEKIGKMSSEDFVKKYGKKLKT